MLWALLMIPAVFSTTFNTTTIRPSSKYDRVLAIGDFEELNSIFRGAEIKLPDATVNQRILGINLGIDISNLRCTDIAIGDLAVTYNKESLQKLSFRLDVIQLDLTCYLDYRWNYAGLSDNGSADAYTENNGASISLSFLSPNFDEAPPNSLDSESCQTTIRVVDLDFRGGPVGSILDAFESLIRGTVENAVEDVACGELEALVDGSADDLITFVQDFLDPYLGPIAPEYSDPLFAETNLAVPDGVSLLNVSDTESLLGGWFNTALQEIDRLLGNIVDDKDGPTGSGRDLGVNKFLRDSILDDERAFVVDIADLSSVTDGVVFDMHDTLTQTQMVLTSVKIFGLDTFTRFEPLQDIGSYTLQNELSWQYLTIEIDVDITIRPSTLEDSVIANPGAEVVEEQMKIRFGVDNVDAVVSFLLAIDDASLGSLPLGSLLDSANILPCLLSVIHDFELSALGVSVGNIREPTLNGFVSRGIDRVVSKTVEAVFEMYEGILLQAVPKMFQTTLRDMLNRDVIDALLQTEGGNECPTVSFDESLDFRDFLLSPGAAKAVGGTGEEPYGDLGSMVRDLVLDELLSPDADGLPSINSAIVAPLTESQSGTPGSLKFADALFDFVQDGFTNKFVSAFLERFEFSVFDTRVSNLDTITFPLTLLNPTTDPNTLANLISVGPMPDRTGGKDLTGKIRFLLALDGPASPFQMRNEFDLVVKIPATAIAANLYAKIDGQSFANFAVEDILNGDCWLALFAPSPIDDTNNGNNNGNATMTVPTESNLGLGSFMLTMFGFSINAECVSCSSAGTAVLGGVSAVLESSGAVDFFRSRLEMFVTDFVTGDWASSTVDRLTQEAPYKCPHHPMYNTNSSVSTSRNDNGLTGMFSKDSVETIILGGALAVEVAMIVFADTHLKMARTQTDPLSGEAKLKQRQYRQLQQSEDKNGPATRFLDWTNLGQSFGPIADMGFEQLRRYLEGSEDGTLTVNTLLQDFLLEDDGSLTVDLNGWAFSEAGITVEVHSVKLVGLDSIESVEMVNPIGPQTIQNALTWQNLTLVIDADVAVTESNGDTSVATTTKERVVFTATATGIDVDLSLLLAVDAVAIEAMELGSVLSSATALSCLLSTIDTAEVTQLKASAEAFSTPELSGFLSPSVQETLDRSIQALFSAYETDLLDSVPIIFDETVRTLLNNLLSVFLDDETNEGGGGSEVSAVCPSNNFQALTGEVDFRELLLPEDQATALGGRPGQPYGDVGPTVMDLIREELLVLDTNSNDSRINSAIIAPLTESQSGTAGTLRFGNVTSFQSGPVDEIGLVGVALSVSEGVIENLDSVGFPLELLAPNSTNGQLLDNSIALASSQTPLRASTTIVVDLEGTSPVLNMRNEIELSLSVADVSVLAGIVARLDERAFMTFPLGQISSLTCWLATFVTPALDEDGFRLDPSAAASLAFDYLHMVLNALTVDAQCVSCTSTGLDSLPELTSILRNGGIIDDLNRRLVAFGAEILTGDLVEVYGDRLLADAV